MEGVGSVGFSLRDLRVKVRTPFSGVGGYLTKHQCVCNTIRITMRYSRLIISGCLYPVFSTQFSGPKVWGVGFSARYSSHLSNVR